MKIHPLDGNPDGKKTGFWDVFSETYTSEPQGNMPGRIAEWLFDIGVLNPGSDVLEIGSGPGTYSFPFAAVSKSVTCLDSSAGMLKRLRETADSEGIGNVETMNVDWDSFNPGRRWDVVAATLCSFMGTPESLDKMDSLAGNNCVMVSWIRNHNDDLQNEIWAGLGKEYSFADRKTDNITEILESTGRVFENKVFSDRVRTELSIGEAVKRNASTYSVFGLEDEARGIAERIIEERSVDGVYVLEAENVLRVNVWSPLKR